MALVLGKSMALVHLMLKVVPAVSLDKVTSELGLGSLQLKPTVVLCQLERGKAILELCPRHGMTSASRRCPALLKVEALGVRLGRGALLGVPLHLPHACSFRRSDRCRGARALGVALTRCIALGVHAMQRSSAKHGEFKL
eukprot:CAMPEP_0185174484 /NCGR_PEP_ID=MMETSP1139-20130426/25307_1 /TAXON_ID=298111 /ORGANISM="Pavlova sp., Strain CCMP459" /LENGTH=139 /DNA_ID=CAMNT_0027740197 /DNA_START=41 /DNA_END=460 /DNA_ORIENTATION=+